MIDKKRLYLMIGMARFKQRNEDTTFRINKYYQNDYIGFAMIRNFLLSTIAYVLLLGLVALGNMETLLSNLNELDFRPLIAAIIVGYLVFLGIYMVLAYVRAKLRYVRMQNDIERYEEALRRLSRMYREEKPERHAVEDYDQEGDL